MPLPATLSRIASSAVAAACLVFVHTSHAASTPDPAAKMDRLLDISGIAHMVRQVLPGMNAGFDEPGQKIPMNLRYALREAAGQAFQPDAMIERVRARMSTGMSAREIDDTLAWLETPLGRRITAMENETADVAAIAKIQAYGRELERRPLPARRAELIRELDAATGASEVNVLTTEAGILAVALGMNAAQPVQQQLRPEVLRENVKAAVPQLRQQITDVVRMGMSYTYRRLSDQELESYLKFLKSPSGAAYSKAAVAGMTDAMLEASGRFVQVLPKAIAKHKGTAGT